MHLILGKQLVQNSGACIISVSLSLSGAGLITLSCGEKGQMWVRGSFGVIQETGFTVPTMWLPREGGMTKIGFSQLYPAVVANLAWEKG